MPVLVEDLADTHQFNPTLQPLPAGIGATPPEQFYLPGTTSRLWRNSAPLSSIALFLRRLFHSKLGWLAILLLLVVSIASGLVIARDVVRQRRQERYEQIRDAELNRRARQARQAQVFQQQFDTRVQNAMGFRPESLVEGEFPGIQGVFVASLTSDYSPAAIAKIQAGDVITELNGQAAPGSREFMQILDGLKTGVEVPLKLYRDGQTSTTSIRIADRSVPPLQPKIDPREQGFLGVGNVTRRCCAPGSKKEWGLQVWRLVDNSPADLGGLQLGDLIVQFDGKPTLTPDEFARQIQNTKPRSKVKIKFYRGGSEQTLELTLGHGW
jgi:S1-C subfamily serine protease